MSQYGNAIPHDGEYVLSRDGTAYKVKALTSEQWEAMYGQASKPLNLAEIRKETARYIAKRYSNLSRPYSEGGTITPRGQAGGHQDGE